MRKKIIAMLMVAAGFVSVAGCGSVQSDPYASVPACMYEDGSDTEGTGMMCKWDAATMGNGQGTGVYVYRGGELIARY